MQNVGLPNSLLVAWAGRTFFFTSFLARNDAYNLIVKLWQQCSPAGRATAAAAAVDGRPTGSKSLGARSFSSFASASVGKLARVPAPLSATLKPMRKLIKGVKGARAGKEQGKEENGYKPAKAATGGWPRCCRPSAHVCGWVAAGRTRRGWQERVAPQREWRTCQGGGSGGRPSPGWARWLR